jgi:hypothetical protein
VPRSKKVKEPKPEPKSSPEARAKAVSNRDRLIFNLAPGEKTKIKKFQDDKCAITGEVLGSAFYLDHAHDDGLVRGILSFKVNKGLALFDDNPAYLRAAADYIDDPPAPKALGEKVYGVLGRVTKKATRKQGKKRVNNRLYGPDGTPHPQPRAVFTNTKGPKKSGRITAPKSVAA